MRHPFATLIYQFIAKHSDAYRTPTLKTPQTIFQKGRHDPLDKFLCKVFETFCSIHQETISLLRNFENVGIASSETRNPRRPVSEYKQIPE